MKNKSNNYLSKERQFASSKKSAMFDGTSDVEFQKALSHYLNITGPGDYNLPSLIGT